MRLGYRIVGEAHIEENASIFKKRCGGISGEILFEGFSERCSRRSFDGSGHSRLPVLPRTQIGDVRGVMARVPCVECENRGESLAATFRVVIAAKEVHI